MSCLPDIYRELVLENKIRLLRTERGWSQAQLAQQVKVSRQAINAVETGKFDPSLPLAFAIAILFGRTIEDVFLYEAKD